MPIGFWAVSRKGVRDLADHIYKQRYGEAPPHHPRYFSLLNRIAYHLPKELQAKLEDFIEDAVIDEGPLAPLE